MLRINSVLFARAWRACAVVSLTGTTALAQRATVRGYLFMADSVTRASGVLVEARAADGSLAGRALSDSRGAFTVQVPSAGAYELRALRIGFRPAVVTATTGTDVQVRIVLNTASVSLAAVRVTGDDQCRVRADTGQLMATAWEMARTALATAVEGESRTGLRAVGLVYHSWREESGAGQLWQTYGVNPTLTARPFVSAPPEQLARDGYSVRTPDGMDEFVGPDADALISDAFAAGHCFRIVASDAVHGDAIGIAFRPVRDRSRVVDIAGTFWLDRASGELRLLEFRYTNAPADLERMHAGGRIEYRRLSSGDWVVNRWSIRLPTVLEHNVVNRSIPTGGRAPMVQTRDEGTVWIAVNGGELLSAAVGADELYEGKGTQWRGRVSAADGTLRGATIEVPAASYFAEADSSGSMQLDHVQPGSYDALLSTSATRIIGLAPFKKRITIASGAPPESLALPSDDEVLRIRCGKDAIARNRAAIFGVALGTGDRPLAHDTMYVRWMSNAEASSGGRLDRARAEMVTTDVLGRWVVCGVPRAAKVALSLTDDARDGGEVITATIGRDDRLVEISVRWNRR